MLCAYLYTKIKSSTDEDVRCIACTAGPVSSDMNKDLSFSNCKWTVMLLRMHQLNFLLPIGN